jgi:hypothetical protein
MMAILLVVFAVFGKKAVPTCNTLQEEIRSNFKDLGCFGSRLEIEFLMLLIAYVVFSYFERKLERKYKWEPYLFWLVTFDVVCYCVHVCYLYWITWSASEALRPYLAEARLVFYVLYVSVES